MRRRACSLSRLNIWRRSPGFTSLEVLMVVAIVAVMATMLLPALQKAREAARKSTCKDNMRLIGLAFHNYHEDYGSFPMPYSIDYPLHDGQMPGPTDSLNSHSWGQMLLPYLDQSRVYSQIDMTCPSLSEETASIWNDVIEGFGGPGYSSTQLANIVGNEAAISTPLAIFNCPSTTGGPRLDKHFYPEADLILGLPNGTTNVTYASTDYATLNGVLGRFTDNFYTGPQQANREGIMRQPNLVTRKRDVIDGLSNTWLMSERAGANDVWRDGHQIWDAGNGVFIEPDGGDYNVQSGGGWGDFVNGEFWLAGSLEDGTGTKGPCLINCVNLDTRGIYSFHPGGIHVLLGDASAKLVSEFINTDLVVQAISSDGMTPGGGF